MTVFGLITEGITDQIVIEALLVGFYNNKDIRVEALQPIIDETDEDTMKETGNWHKVFEYCQSEDFKDALRQEGQMYPIIQIDTDVLTGDIDKKYQVSKKDNDGKELSTEEYIEKVKNKFIELIGKELYEKYQDKIIFAISVDSIECWLLPLYYQDKKKAKTVNCLETLNQKLKATEKFFIEKKEPKYYRSIAKKYWKHKSFMKLYEENPSLKIFIEDLQNKNITFEEEEDW